MTDLKELQEAAEKRDQYEADIPVNRELTKLDLLRWWLNHQLKEAVR